MSGDGAAGRHATVGRDARAGRDDAVRVEVPGLVPAWLLRAAGGLALALAVALVPAGGGRLLAVGLLLGAAVAVRPSALLVGVALGGVLVGVLLAGPVQGPRLHALVLLVPVALVALRTAAAVPARAVVDRLLLARLVRRLLVVQVGAQALAVLAALLGDRPPSTAAALGAVLALGGLALVTARR
ncbi:hypothetical protein [Cellulomonas marina]|uniref:Uncharacterized protein n=1 Tax=Cellulomonas marina TaxID=988821 RepID=A0A1I0W6E4_9CELL|nr:hypothetical protein [Cellulomonas marina]GIG29994.1 hypothetical protein Cma02nite_25940 [Cellulomonas marina]SFA83603.1 hypothetical protein SAMN05421867_102177 [Cellulomonas marina]